MDKQSIVRTVVCSLAVLVFSIPLSAQNKSRIYGVVVDKQSGEPMISTNVVITGTTKGVATDLDGNYSIEVAPGEYSLTASYISYLPATVTGIKVGAGESVKIDITMLQESVGLEEITVTASSVSNTDAGLLNKRQKAVAFSDAISAETISRSGSGDAAAAMSKVTGASVVEGKYVFVRGLGERYSSTHLNGVELPSADPDKKSFQLDLFPTNLIDNITTIKTFTPDKPGNFSGGLVDVTTKTFPEKRTFSLSMTSAFNSQVTFNNNFLTYSGSSTDWLGFDNGSRDVPGVIDEIGTLPTYSNSIRTNAAQAHRLDAASKAFSVQMDPHTARANPNMSANFSYGDQIQIGNYENPFGLVISGNYGSNYSYYGNGEFSRWFLAGRVDEVNGLAVDQQFQEQKGSHEVSTGGMFSLSHKIGLNKFTANTFYSRNGESTARYLQGFWPSEIADDRYEARVLGYKQRDILTRQLVGEHVLEGLNNARVDWTVNLATTSQDEPSLRMFANQFAMVDLGGAVADTVYRINAQSYDRPNHFFRNLTEDNLSIDLKTSIPILVDRRRGENLKFGFYSQNTDRNASERRFEIFELSTGDAYNGNPGSYFSPENMGIVDSTRLSNGTYRYTFGNYVTNASDPRNQYTAKQDITAAFLMFELRPLEKLRLVGGLRYETTLMDVVSQDTSAFNGNVDAKDFLPSLGATYELSERSNLRASYGRTLARPSFREIAPFYYFEFVGGYVYSGNPQLQRTIINNFDLRYEVFPNPGEIMTASLFYKDITNPIERTFLVESERFTHRNEKRGQVYGIELEYRKNFQFGRYHYLQPNVNVSLIQSVVDINPEEVELIKSQDPDGETTRPLFGQSPYIVNVDLAYRNQRTKTSVTLLYNVYGQRLHEVIVGATPDIYEKPRNLLNMTLEQPLTARLNLKAVAGNILNAPFRYEVDYKGTPHTFSRYTTGRTFNVSVAYRF